ncbi:MAG TPA: response regulator transcription factor [Desulfobulbaceae bacterium]|nr:response regulator transcription factor [Desulfobulbaceae bacterium]
MADHGYRIVIADDHSLIRKGLRTIIELESDMQVIGEAGDGEELLKFLASEQPDMVIMDISMPNINGIDAIGKVLSLYPGIRILMLTMHRNSQYFYNAVSAGAHGYLIKDDSDTELLTAIDTVRSGKTYISPQLSSEVADTMLSAFREHRDPSIINLTPRERDVLDLVVKGHTSKQIADILCLSPRTIDHHRASLLKKFKMKNTVDLVKYVVKNSLVPE